MAVEVEIRNDWAERLRLLQVGESLHYRELSWDDYLDISEEIGERRLLTYLLEGEMEITWAYSPLLRWIGLLNRFVCSLSDELRVPRLSVGMSTLRRHDLELTIEPCRAFYFTNEEKVRGRDNLDLSILPPPDLVLEVEVTSSVEKRMRVYAGLGVPEVWRFDGEYLTANRLGANGEYVLVEHSQYFPNFPLNEFIRFGQMSPQLADTPLATEFSHG